MIRRCKPLPADRLLPTSLFITLLASYLVGSEVATTALISSPDG